MKPVLLTMIALLAACSGPVPAPPCQIVVNVSPPAAVIVPQRPAAERAVVKHFDRMKARELGVVFGEGITADQIERIHAADQDARTALTLLGRHPAKAALDAARTAVQSLEQALEPPVEEVRP
jgi:hypothetical protein